ncbi:MAG: hypothetical protein R3182_05555 [Draconibacterium sp.]|nr:hypothetical protein [Draconibacterium sp.]
MWFNILKIEGRRAAYRLFINSMIHQGELIPPKPPEELVYEGEMRLYGFETRNGHFGWEVEYDKKGRMGKFYLAYVPNDIETHTDYIEGMFEQEYPEQYAALEKFFKENSPRSQEKNQLQELEQGINFSDEYGLPKKVIRKVIEDFSIFKRMLATNINESVLASQYTRAEARRLNNQIHRNVEFRYNDILKRYKEVIDTPTSDPRYNIPTDSILGKIAALLRVIAFSYREQIRQNNPNLIWENFVNFATFFRDDYLTMIQDKVPPEVSYGEQPEVFGVSILEGVMSVHQNEIFGVVQGRWNRERDAITLIENLRMY